MVETPAGLIAVWNVHLFPPFRVPPPLHDQQATALAADIVAVDGPLIVAGDFNATDQSVTYQWVNRYLKNAHRETGWGFGFTYPAPPHIIPELSIDSGLIYRIDHIFYNHHFAAYNAQTLTTSAGSDHLPIVAELWLVK
jgi:endonuclease/exonuclease/phosphatase (EEP) superfamily protein YafD